ncbi:MAG TPA: ATP-binding protein [Luteibacter sp.]|uniref:AAA family ATPase n=1 Tax=Luteibacter sp. TaxID=1886636 RepID=UPI002B754F42|nr:ATP-binding protein [Luteibacter sp.]HVI54799.1 ATP-binding protein [Luteibacter sp.]
MLHSYAITNSQSFITRAEVSFRLTQKASSRGWDEESSTGHRLATAMAVVGPNGAGKTSLIKPLAFLNWFTAHSFQSQPTELIPIRPHFSAPNEPVEFELEADDADGVLWRYVLKATPERVLHESLHKKPNKKGAKFSYVFVRDWNDEEEHYSIKQDGFGLNAAEAKKVRQNASLISTAAQYGVELAQQMAAVSVSSNIMQIGRLNTDAAFGSATRFFHGNDVLREKMEALLRAWDLGLSGVSIRKIDFPFNPELKLPEGVSPASQYIPFGVHTLKDGSKIELPLMEESSGTKTAFVTLWYVLSVLSTGGIAVVDELESDMHPHMIEPLLELFASRVTNPHNAQIIFTSHSVEVMNLLGKSQVVLVEKNHCESASWRLDSMEGVRSQDNLYAKYMSGAYGAIPQL